MPRRIASRDEVTIEIDLSGMFGFLGAGKAISKSMKTKKYASSLFETAFTEADEEFNVRAAAFASATGRISHMYEWGTLGINRAKTNMRPNPMNANARLWETVAPGTGFDRYMTYYFKPSVAYVPKPNTTKTNMDPAVIAAMRDQTFRWKAEIMEWGRWVTIRPKRAKFLLIPVTSENEDKVRPHDRKRGYMLTKGPVTFQAGGKKYANNFTEFFGSYWDSTGADILNASIERQFLLDYEPKLVATKRYTKLVPAYANKSIAARVDEKAKEYTAEIEAAAAKRAARAKARRKK